MPAPPALGALSVEVWRLGKRLGALPEPNDRLNDSVRRLTAELDKLGVRIEDRMGEQFVEGLNADIVDQPDACDPATERIIISDVLRPAIYINGVCVVPSQIVLSRAEETP